MDTPATTSRWTLNRVLALLLTAGLLLLLVETRVEHDHLLARKPLAYVPFVFAFLAFLVSLTAAIRWKPGAVKLVLRVSLLAIPVGIGGLWFHNQDRLEQRGESDLRSGEARSAVPEPMGRSEQQLQGEQRPEGERPAGERQRIDPERRPRRRLPPMLAPLAFVGIGLLGTLIALRRWPGDVV